MFEEFSAGYYVGQLYIKPYDGEHAVMERDQHEEANEQIYVTGDGVERLDNPLVMKLDDHHFPVLGTNEVPTDTLAMPDAIIEANHIDDPPTLTEILVAKADRAAQLLEWFTPYTIQESAL